MPENKFKYVVVDMVTPSTQFCQTLRECDNYIHRILDEEDLAQAVIDESIYIIEGKKLKINATINVELNIGGEA